MRRDAADHAAYRAQPAVARRRIVGTQPAADRRAEAVGADQDVAGLAATVGERQHHAVAVALEARALARQHEIAGRRRLEQRAVDGLAQRHQRRRVGDPAPRRRGA